MRLRRRAPDTKEKLLLTFFPFFVLFCFTNFKEKKCLEGRKGFSCILFPILKCHCLFKSFFVNFLNYFSFLKYKLIFFKIFWYIKKYYFNIFLIKKYFIKNHPSLHNNSKASGITGQSRMRFPRELFTMQTFQKKLVEYLYSYLYYLNMWIY
jgi:hypothetical protein